MRFMFCTACPAAPFTRLSMAATTTARPVSGIERDADIAEIGVRDGVQIGHVAGVVEADEGLGGVVLVVDGEQFIGAGDAGGAEVDGLENAAIDGDELRGEAEFALLEAGW